MADVMEINDGNFEEEVLKSSSPVLVDFWAPWCGPCRTIAPVLEDISKDFGDKIKVVKLNVDENQQSANKYDVLSIPTLFLFHSGEVKKKIVGSLAKNRLIDELSQWLT